MGSHLLSTCISSFDVTICNRKQDVSYSCSYYYNSNTIAVNKTEMLEKHMVYKENISHILSLLVKAWHTNTLFSDYSNKLFFKTKNRISDSLIYFNIMNVWMYQDVLQLDLTLCILDMHLPFLCVSLISLSLPFSPQSLCRMS